MTTKPNVVFLLADNLGYGDTRQARLWPKLQIWPVRPTGLTDGII